MQGFSEAVVAGVTGAGVVEAVSKFGDLFAEMAKTAIDDAAKIADAVVRIGTTFEELNAKVATFTDASGTALQHLQDDATKVFAQLDTGAQNLGETLGVLNQRFDLTDSQLQKLSYDFTELNSRLGGLDIRTLSSALLQFGVDGQHADAALLQLAGDAQKFGDKLSTLESEMVTAGPTFDLLGASFNSTAQALARIDQLGDPAQKVLQALNASGKEFAKTASGGEDFKKFITDNIDAIEYYKAHNQEGEAESLAATLFGTRSWSIALQTLKDVRAAMDQVSDVPPLNIDPWIQATQTLDDKWQQFIHGLETDLKPIGEAAMGGLTDALGSVSGYLSQHHDEIVAKIKDFGDAFIREIPEIQQFVGEGIRLLGMFYDFMKEGAAVTLSTLSTIMQAWGTITGSDKDVKMGQSMMNMANTLNKLDFSKLSDTIANAIETPFDPAKIQQKFDEAFAAGGTGKLGASIDITPVPKSVDGSPLTDPKGIFGIPPDGLHIPVIPDSPPGQDTRPPITTDNPWFVVPTPWGSVPAHPPTTQRGGQGPPPIHPSGYHVALADYSTPMPNDGTRVVLASGYGRGGGGPDHSANKGYGSTGPDDLSGGGGYISAPGFLNDQVYVQPGEKPSVAMERAKKSADDQERMTKLQGDVDDLQAQRDALMPGDKDARAAGIDAKLFAAKKALADALEQQTIDAQKQTEGSKSSKSAKSADPGDLLGPLLDALGLGSVLGGTNPENWGIVKLLKGLAGWGFGEANAIGDAYSSGSILKSLGLGNVAPRAQGSTGPGAGGPGGGPGGPADGSGGTGGPSGPAAFTGALNWDALAAKEAGGDWHNKSNPKYRGGLQFDQQTWDESKPPGAPDDPADATREQQIEAGKNAMTKKPAANLWPENHDQLNTPLPAQSPGGSAPSISAPSIPKSWFGGGGVPTPGTGYPQRAPGASSGVTGAAPAGFNPRTAASYGLPKGSELHDPSMAGFPAWAQQLGKDFGVYGTTYAGHQEKTGENRGIDWWPAGAKQDMSGKSYTPEQDARLQAFANYLGTVPGLGTGDTGAIAGQPGMVIYEDPNTGKRTGFWEGKNAIGMGNDDVYGSSGEGYPGHTGHVHLSTAFAVPEPNVSAAPNVQPGPGVAPAGDTGGPAQVHFAGDYRPTNITGNTMSNFDAVRPLMDEHHNAQMASAGGTGGLPV
jgi:hypothetical protein